MKCRMFIMSLFLSMSVPIFTIPCQVETASVHSEVFKYSKSEIQAGLTKAIENHYYKFKDQDIPNPRYKVSDVRVLQYVQRGDVIGLVGQCRVDGKLLTVTGILGKDKKRREWQFGGGWSQRGSHEVYWGAVGSPFKGEMFISGLTSNRSISQLRITHVNGQSVVIPVSKEGYFTSFIPKPEIEGVRGFAFLVEGLDRSGHIVYPAKHKLAALAAFQVKKRYPGSTIIANERVGKTNISPSESEETYRLQLRRNNEIVLAEAKIRYVKDTGKVTTMTVKEVNNSPIKVTY